MGLPPKQLVEQGRKQTFLLGKEIMSSRNINARAYVFIGVKLHLQRSVALMKPVITTA